MESITVRRRRATLLNADIKGYSAMMALDEARTFQALVRNMSWLARAVAAHGGRVIDTCGDGLLAAFDDETNASSCAISIQLCSTERNHGLPPEFQIVFRVGLHSGDVIEHDGRLCGDAVNIAARLQEAATPGGVLISGAVAERLAGSRWFASEASYRLKNIPSPVRAVQLRL